MYVKGRNINKYGRIYIVTIPSDIAKKLDLKPRERVFVAILFDKYVLWLGVRSVTKTLKYLAISLPASEGLMKVWSFLHQSRTPVDLVISRDIEELSTYIQCRCL